MQDMHDNDRHEPKPWLTDLDKHLVCDSSAADPDQETKPQEGHGSGMSRSSGIERSGVE